MGHEVTERVHRFHHDEDVLTEEQTFGPLTIDGTKYRHVAVSSGGAFHAAKCLRDAYDHSTKVGWRIIEVYHGDIYTPPHPSTTVENCEGATYAHDTGTHWLFSRCSPKEHVDFAAEVRTWTEAQFALAISKANRKLGEATNASAISVASGKVTALVKFAEAAGKLAQSTVLGAVLGHYHKDAHQDHMRDLAVEAINATLADWKKRGLTDTGVRQERAAVLPDTGAIVTALTKTHIIEWPHARAARLEAEKKKKEAETQAEGTDTPASDQS